MARRELKYQKAIIDEINAAGGYAKKWATEYSVGVPDLICCLPEGQGVYFPEIKHLPTWDGQREIKNPMTAKQKIEGRKITRSGANTLLIVAIGHNIKESSLVLVESGYDVIHTNNYRLKLPRTEMLGGRGWEIVDGLKRWGDGTPW